eukprot:3651034-Rhodomonas_salina.2
MRRSLAQARLMSPRMRRSSDARGWRKRVGLPRLRRIRPERPAETCSRAPILRPRFGPPGRGGQRRGLA